MTTLRRNGSGTLLGDRQPAECSAVRPDSGARSDPPTLPAGVPHWLGSLRRAICDSVSEADIREMVAAQVKAAKQGDARACKFVLDNVLGNLKGATLVQNTYTVQLLPSDPQGGTGSASATGSEARATVAASATPLTLSPRERIHTLLQAAGPLDLGRICRETGLLEDTVRTALDHEWFTRADLRGLYRLAVSGR